MLRRILPFICILALVGCTQSTADFWARIDPNRAQVPYEATITAANIGNAYTFHLPGETITQDSPTLIVTVGSLDWSATVETTCGGNLYTKDVHATGSNAPPEVTGVIINGIKNRSELCPKERTLLEFIVSPGAQVVNVDVWGDAFPQHYSVFCPPYNGSYRVLWRGNWRENACVIYPVYCAIPGEALPYSPTGLDEGYPYLGWRETNAIDYGPSVGYHTEIPAQAGHIMVTVECPFGRQETYSFEVHIRAQNFRNTDGTH